MILPQGIAICLATLAGLVVVAGAVWLWLGRGNVLLLELSFMGCL